MKTILVTGAAGFIGSHSTEVLLNNGAKVVGIDNFRTGRQENLESALKFRNFEFVKEDITEEVTLRSLFRRYRFDGVLHLAALVSVPESFEKLDENYHINVAASDLLCRLCVEHDCRRLVFASSAAVYGDTKILPNREYNRLNPQSPYAAAKLASEVMLLGYAASFGLDVVCFRYFNVYGPRQDPNSPYSGVLSIFLERFRKGLPVTVYGDGEQTRDFIYVEDVAHANCQAVMDRQVINGQYNLCTGKAISINKVLEIFREAFPNPPSVKYAKPRTGDIRHSVGDPSLARKTLGILAQIPVQVGLRRCLPKSGRISSSPART